MNTNILLLLSISITLFSLSCNTQKSPNDYQIIWSDEFDYSGLPDASKWLYDTEGNPYGWGNSEIQFYTEQRIENASVKHGVLNITAIKETWQDKAYTSARLISNAVWKYGKFEIRAKIPAGRGTWSAIWMMPPKLFILISGSGVRMCLKPMWMIPFILSTTMRGWANPNGPTTNPSI